MELSYLLSLPYHTVALMAALGTLIGLALQWAENQLPPDTDAQVDAINQVLPQTQCAQCGYPGCRPYAVAIQAQNAAINLCPPGGDATVKLLAELTGQPAQPLRSSADPNIRAVIREDECIGCTLCIEACPVDAIVGSQQKTHTVIRDECTGCELCLPPCPVNCIDLITTTSVEPTAASKPADDCIRCGDCIVVCPRALSPVQLYWHRSDPDQLNALRLDACIECRRCDRVCPSELPLTDVFVAAKQQLQQDKQRTQAAQHAAARYDARQARLSQVHQPVAAANIPTPDELLSLARGQRKNGDRDE